MWLLLNACDVEMAVQAIFRHEPSKVPLRLAKKLQQLDLYDIPGFMVKKTEHSALPDKQNAPATQNAPAPHNESASQNEQAIDVGNDLDWDWVEHLPAGEIASKLEQSKYIITV